jgi:hypothetical protein
VVVAVVFGAAVTALSVDVTTANGAGVTSSTPHQAPASPDLSTFLPGHLRIDGTRWVQLLGRGSAQLEVRYRSFGSGSPSSGQRLLVLAWNRTTGRWASVVDGPAADLTSALVPADSTVAGQFALGLIAALDTRATGAVDISATPGNVALLEAWMANEGGLWADNPLNTSLDAARYPHQFTSSGLDTGIPIYPSLGVGIEETATTLLSNPSYARILTVLDHRSATCVAFASAVIESPWAASHYGYDPSGFCPADGVPDLDASLRGAVRPRSHRPGPGGRHRARPARARVGHPVRAVAGRGRGPAPVPAPVNGTRHRGPRPRRTAFGTGTGKRR